MSSDRRSRKEAPFFDIHTDDPEVGRMLGGYRLLRLIGRGGTSKVYLAESPRWEGRFAFKLARHSLRGTARRRFADEAGILARLRHENIVALKEAGTVGVNAVGGGGTVEAGRPFSVLEYVDGRPIDEACRDEPLASRLNIFLGVCAAVSHAHSRSVAHLDLKPGNILVTSAGVAKLLDFGIAHLILRSAPGEAVPQGRRQPMTLPYASPEQARGEAVSAASDIYSLGAVLYRLLTGRLPYELPALAGLDEIRRRISDSRPPAPSTVASSDGPEFERALAGPLDRIILAALAKDPRRRPSVAKLASELRRYLEPPTRRVWE